MKTTSYYSGSTLTTVNIEPASMLLNRLAAIATDAPMWCAITEWGTLLQEWKTKEQCKDWLEEWHAENRYHDSETTNRFEDVELVAFDENMNACEYHTYEVGE